MVDLGSQRGPLGLTIIDTPTTVDCARQVRFRRGFRSLVECMVPCCGLFHQTTSSSSFHTNAEADDYSTNIHHHASSSSSSSPSSVSSTSFSSSTSSTTSTVTGTFFGRRKGRVSFCLQDDSRSSSPLLLLEFGVPTSYLAKEMQTGSLRIALECDRRASFSSSSGSGSGSPRLYGVPVWSMYCNGRKVGFAVRRHPSPTDASLLKLMRSVSVGAGVFPVAANSGGGDNVVIMYLRASFERVIGSPDSEAFHIINPVGSSAQELSIFLLRS